jgi:hypothetical protein
MEETMAYGLERNAKERGVIPSGVIQGGQASAGSSP